MQNLPKANKATTFKGKKILQSRLPQLFEKERYTLFMKGTKTSQVASDFMKIIYSLKKKYSLKLSKRIEMNPLCSSEQIVKECKKAVAPLFIFANHSKKRPNNIIIGRIYDDQLLDCFEFELLSFRKLEKGKDINLNSQYCIFFQGDTFETNAIMIRLKNLFLDFFVGSIEVKEIDYQNQLQTLISFYAFDDQIIYVRFYNINDEKKCEETGLQFDLKIRRNQMSNEEVFKKSCQKFKSKQKKNQKNQQVNDLGETIGQVFVDKQMLDGLQLKKRKL